MRPHITLFSSSGYINDMASGSICVALGWSGDINIARQRAIDGKTGKNIQALIPKTGGLLFFDVMVIPADAPRPGNAHKFINYILRPEVHAGADEQGLLRQPEHRVEEVHPARGRQQPDRLPGAGRPGQDDRRPTR